MPAAGQKTKPSDGPKRRTQAERRKGTRDAIYVAATQCLIDDGLTGFKTARVAKLAGVSEGSIYRYFPTKADLLAATMERVFAELRDAYEEGFADLEGEQLDAQTLTQALWTVIGDERLLALRELITNSRHDAALRDALKPVIARHRVTMHAGVRRLLRGHPLADWPMLGGAIDAVVHAMQGMQLHDLVVRNPAHVRLMLDFVTFTIDVGLQLFDQIDDENSPLNTGPSKYPTRS